MSVVAIKQKRVSLDIQGMTCSACVSRLERAFQRTDGIASAMVNLPLEKATLIFDPNHLDLSDIREVVEKTGFDIGTESREFFVEGMTCGACASRVEAALLNVPGVLTAEVNLALEKARVKAISHAVNIDRLVEAVTRSGYQLLAPSDSQTATRETERKEDSERRLLIIAGLICIPFLVQMVAQFLNWEDIHMMPAAEVVLASIIQLLVGIRFYKSAFNALKGGTANMDVLVTLGTSSAYFFSWYLMVSLGEAAEGELYFEAAALILTFVLLGKQLEARAKKATTSAIRELMDLRPPTTRIQNEAGQWVECSVNELVLGTHFEVRPGDRLPADGIVRQGLSSLDESLLTGESMPAVKSEGDAVFEGSINIEGRLIVETTALGSESTIQKIIDAVENAQHGKLNVQRLVDRVSGVFAPVVIGIALVAFIAWLSVSGNLEIALINAVSVLVIACPCALGLATPTAIVAGTGVAARAGVIFKDIHSVELAQRVNLIAFDKTGTLTTKEPSISEITTTSSLQRQEVLAIAASIQSQSEHPLARAFVDAANREHVNLLEIEDFESYVAEGVSATIAETRYWVGNERILKRVGLAADIESNGDLYLVANSDVLAQFEVKDSLRDEAKVAVQKLSDLNISTQLISGDTEIKSRLVAQQLGMTEYQARLKPEEKVIAIEQLSESGKVVGMVGDGVNDAPALARADLGIAMGNGAGVALNVAPVTLMRPDLRLVATAIEASIVTFRKIKQNLFWAFLYNVVMLPLAALGFLTPTLAGVAMALSSVSVVCNSLLLRRWKPAE